jgi:hypothetical protein
MAKTKYDFGKIIFTIKMHMEMMHDDDAKKKITINSIIGIFPDRYNQHH